MQKLYTDIDYESFPVADLDLDLHWIQLPKAVYAAKCQAHAAAREQERLKELPADHKVILVPADPAYSPREEELWPIVNRTIQQELAHHPAIRQKIIDAILATRAEYRGWRNPFPANLHYPTAKK